MARYLQTEFNIEITIMASNGLINIAKNGKCRICKRTRPTGKYVKAVGEVKHGYATGHVWECINIEECDRVAIDRSNDKTRKDWEFIRMALEQGRYTQYMYFD